MNENTPNKFATVANVAWKISVLALLSVLIYKVDDNKHVKVSGYVDASIMTHSSIPVYIKQYDAIPVKIENRSVPVNVENYSVKVHVN